MSVAMVVIESETVEFKTSLAELKAGLVSICAILNKHASGEVWFGIKNNGSVVGLTVTDKTLRDVSQAIAAHIEPKIYPNITREKITGKHCLKISFTSKTPPLQLRCAVFAGIKSHNIIDRHDFDGDILELIEESQKYILKNIHIGMRLQGLYREDVPEISTAALREAIINAFCHRDYRDPDYIHIAIFKDRVEIRSPGGLYDGLTISKMRKGNVSKRRNPLIADLFRRIQMVEAWGRGMPLILESEPGAQFHEIAKVFIASFGRPSFTEKTKEASKLFVSGAQSGAQSDVVLAILCQSPLSASDIAKSLGLKSKTGAFKRTITGLLKKGHIEMTIPDKPNSRLQKYRLTGKGRDYLEGAQN